MGTGLYLYGIFPTPGPEQLEAQGLDKQPVHTHDPQINGAVYPSDRRLQRSHFSTTS